MAYSDAEAFSRAVVALYKSAIFKEDTEYWETILAQKSKIEDYVNKVGLMLIVDEIDGYAYLKQRIYENGETEIPRLVPRYALSYPVSLMLVLLRKQLLEFDSTNGDQRLIVTKEHMREKLSLFLRDTNNETKLVRDVDKHVEKIEKMGFLRRLRGNEEAFEVQRILRSFINAQWLSNLNELLDEYKRFAEGNESSESV